MNTLKFNIFEYGWSWGCFCILLILNAFCSLHAYAFWHLNIKTLNIIFGAFTFAFILIKNNWFIFSRKRLFILLLFFSAYFIRFPIGNLNRYLLPILSLAPLYVLFFLKDAFKISLLSYFSKILALIVGISSIGWILFLFNAPLPSFIDFYGEAHEYSNQEYQYMYNNHFLYLENIGVHVEAPRFSCIFLEPGYFGVLMVFLLYIGSFDYTKYENQSFTIGLLLSLSLAGYLMLFGAYIAHTYSLGYKKQFRRLITFFIVIICSIQFFSVYNDGDNIIKKKLLDRLEWNSETGNISGYNRTNEDTDEEFIKVLTSSDAFMGRGVVSNGLLSVGYKPYIIMYGLVGLGLLIITFYLVYKKNKCFDSLIMFVLFVIMFARGHHTVFWQGFWLVYVCGCAKFRCKTYSKGPSTNKIDK